MTALQLNKSSLMLQIATWAISKHSDLYNLATNYTECIVFETSSILRGYCVNNDAAKSILSYLVSWTHKKSPFIHVFFYVFNKAGLLYLRTYTAHHIQCRHVILTTTAQGIVSDQPSQCSLSESGSIQKKLLLTS